MHGRQFGICPTSSRHAPNHPLQLAFNTATAGLISCTPKGYAAWPKMKTDGLDFSHAPPPGSSWTQMAVPHKEILKNACGTEEKTIQPTWLLTVASVGSISVKVSGDEGGDDANSPHMSLSSAAHASQSQHHACLLLQLCMCYFWCHIVHHILLATPHLQTVILKVPVQVPLL